MDSFVGDHVEFSERHDEEFLEVCDCSDSGIGVVGMSRFANGGKVPSHQVDKHPVVGDFEQLLSVDFQYGYSCQHPCRNRVQLKSRTKTDLEQHLDSHGEYTVDDTERENQWHRIDVKTQEPSTRDQPRSMPQIAKRTHGKEATESWTSTEVKWSLIIGKHRCTSDSKTLWSSRVPSIDGLDKVSLDHHEVAYL